MPDDRKKKQTRPTIVIKNGKRFLRMRDESGKWTLKPLPTNDKENDA